MKSLKISFDLSDNPELVEVLRFHAAQTGTTQKNIVVTALEAYFSHKQENYLLLKNAQSTFGEWDNDDDEIYNKL